LGVKEDIIVKKPNGILVYPFFIETNGVTPQYYTTNLAGGVFYDEKGNYLFHFEKPFAIDAKKERTDNVNITIKKDEKTQKLIALLTVDKDWLKSPERIYPITIDPTIIHDTTAKFATGQLNRVIDTGSGSSPNLTTNYQELPADINTVGLWHLNEASGNVLDSSGNSNTGTPTGTTVVTGLLGNARSLNGSSYITVADSNSLDLTSALTIEAWVNHQGAADEQYVVFKRSGESCYGFSINTSNNLYLRTGDGSNCDGIATSANVPRNQWNHVAMTVSGTTVKGYVNEVWLATITGRNITANTANLFIGADSNGNRRFNGIIDEVRISNTARTADQIRQAYEVGARTHNITIDFKAALNSGNLIANTSDLSFTIDSTAYGASSMGSNVYKGDKIIVKENYNGTEYIAQGTVNAVTTSTGAVTVAAWDSGSTAPFGGFTVNATVFKWQREYFDLRGSLSTQRDAITNLTLRVTDGSQGANVWLDDFRSSGGYLTTPAGSTITSSTGNKYAQYRVIPMSYDPAVSASFTSVTLDYTSNSAPATPSLDLPTDTATNQILSTVLKTTTTDADSDYLRYKIQICTDSGMTANCQTFDQTSSQTDWSGQNTQSNTAYTTGTQAVYTIQSALNAATTYYWKIRFWDVNGAAGAWSATQNFTMNSVPSTPSLDLPGNGAGSQSYTPALKTTSTDVDSDYLRYKIQICTDSGMTANCQTFDQTSSQTGWSGQDTQSSTAYTSGTQSTYTVQAALENWKIYYWRSYAKDPGGSNTWSSTQGSPYSFTTMAIGNFNFENIKMEGINID